MATRDPNRSIRADVVIDATVDEVWDAWTTGDGIRSFFAPGCNVEPRVGGLYEIFFAPDAESGVKGADGMRILAFEPGKMLAFTWNAPLSMPNVREQRTSVVLRFGRTDTGGTRLSLAHSGWGEGEEWDGAFDYFTKAWDVVLDRLTYRFSVGPVDWDDPPAVATE